VNLMRLRCCAALLLSVAAAAPAGAQDFDPATLDLAALIECRADVPAYNNFAFWLTGEENGALEKLGWTEVESGNPLLGQFRLPTPVTAFGHQTDNIVFTSSGPMMVLDGVPPQELADKLGVAAVVASSEKVLGEKVIVEKSEEDGGITLKTRIALNVSTVDSHLGKTLAGCSYQIEVQ
jgi:hypothetical protein